MADETQISTPTPTAPDPEATPTGQQTPTSDTTPNPTQAPPQQQQQQQAQPPAQAQPNSPAQPQAPAQPPAQAQQPPQPPSAPKGVSPDDPNAGHPSVQRAGVLHTIAQALGGNQYKISIDPNTGTTTRTPVPVSKGQLGLAIAMEALGGALGGLSVKPGPGNLGRAAGAGYAQVQGEQQQQKALQEQQATSDYSRKFQTAEANMRMYQNAQSFGKHDMDAHIALVNLNKDQINYVRTNSPENLATEHASEADSMDSTKYPITDYYRLPDGVVPRLDQDGKQVYTDPQGNIVPEGTPGAYQAWDNTYAIIHRNAKVPLTDENGNPSQVIKDGQHYNLPWAKGLDNAAPGATVPGVVLATRSGQVASIKAIDQDLQHFYSALNEGTGGTYTFTKEPVLKDPNIQFLVDQAASKYGVDPKLARAVAIQESNGNPTAISPKGAQGVMQLMPATATQMGVTDPLDAAQNVDGGVKYLSTLLQKYGDPKLALAAYNAGPQNVTNQIPNIPETKNYVASISNMAGLTQGQPQGKNKYGEAPDLPSLIKDNPAYAKAIEKFQPFLNQYKGNYEQAIGALGGSQGKDPTSAALISQLYGNHQADFDQMSALNVRQQDADIKSTAEIKQQAADRAAKNEENNSAYEADARAIAGDPNDPGSGDIAQLDKLISQRTADRPKVFAMIKAINPNWSMADAEAKVGVWKDFTQDSGKSSQQVKSGNTLFDHLGRALEASDSYRRINGGEQLNKPLSWWGKNYKGDPLLTELQSSIEPVKSEFFTFLSNNHALTDHDKQVGDDILNWNMSPAVLEANLKQFAETAAYRLKETNNQWERVFRRPFPGLISDDALTAIGKMTNPDGTNRVADILKDMDTGGSILGSSNGRGVPGQSVSHALGRDRAQQPALSAFAAGAKPGEKLVIKNGIPRGYSSDGKTITRPYQTPAQPGAFKTPTGQQLTRGQQVKHPNGQVGTVTGQHPDTGQAVVDWGNGGQQSS